MNQRGFTLIDAVLIILLLGVIATAFAVATPSASLVSLDAVGARIQSDLRYAQQLAVTTGVNHGAIFKKSDQYYVYRGDPANVIIDPVTREKMLVDLSKYRGVSITYADKVEFTPTGGTTVAQDKKIGLISADGQRRDVCIVKNTGAVMIDFPSCRL